MCSYSALSFIKIVSLARSLIVSLSLNRNYVNSPSIYSDARYYRTLSPSRSPLLIFFFLPVAKHQKNQFINKIPSRRPQKISKNPEKNVQVSLFFFLTFVFPDFLAFQTSLSRFYHNFPIFCHFSNIHIGKMSFDLI
jgi:hypothetical protein